MCAMLIVFIIILISGQIPYSWNENDIRMHFDKFGGIYCIDVVRDKATKQSKGTFIKFHKKILF